jgi:hypothetical protein
MTKRNTDTCRLGEKVAVKRSEQFLLHVAAAVYGPFGEALQKLK